MQNGTALRLIGRFGLSTYMLQEPLLADASHANSHASQYKTVTV